MQNTTEWLFGYMQKLNMHSIKQNMFTNILCPIIMLKLNVFFKQLNGVMLITVFRKVAHFQNAGLQRCDRLRNLKSSSITAQCAVLHNAMMVVFHV